MADKLVEGAASASHAERPGIGKVRAQTLEEIAEWVRDVQDGITYERARFRRYLVVVFVVCTMLAIGVVTLMISSAAGVRSDAEKEARNLIARLSDFEKRAEQSAQQLRQVEQEMKQTQEWVRDLKELRVRAENDGKAITVSAQTAREREANLRQALDNAAAAEMKIAEYERWITSYKNDLDKMKQELHQFLNQTRESNTDSQLRSKN
jgi:hypothetical protein